MKNLTSNELLAHELAVLKQENEMLKKRLKGNSLLSNLSQEETICIEQIDILKRRSSEKELTLEEIKRLDLLVKNLKLIREESTVVVSSPKIDEIEIDDLLQIARDE